MGPAVAPRSPCSLAPCPAFGVGKEEQGWKSAKGSVTNSGSWQMLAGFQYSEQEPEGPGDKCQEGSARPAPNLAPPSAGSGPRISLNLLNSFQHTVTVLPQQAPLPRPSPKPVQQKEYRGHEEHSSCLSRPHTRGTHRQFQVEEKPLRFYTTRQEPEHPKKVRGLVLP